MKKLIYLLTVITLFVSCEKDNQETDNKDQIIIEKSSSEDFTNKSSSNCSISGPRLVTPGTTAEYTFIKTREVGAVFSLDFGQAEYADFGDSYIDGNGNFVYDVIFHPGFTCVIISMTTGDGCRDDIVVRTSLNECSCIPSLSIDIAQEPGTCPGDLITFTAITDIPVTGGIYNWSVSSGSSIVSGQGTKNVQVASPASGGVLVSVTYVSDCTGLNASASDLAEFSSSCDGGGFGGF